MMIATLSSPFILGDISLWKHALMLGPEMHNLPYRISEF